MPLIVRAFPVLAGKEQEVRDFAELAEGGKPKLSYFHILTE